LFYTYEIQIAHNTEKKKSKKYLSVYHSRREVNTFCTVESNIFVRSITIINYNNIYYTVVMYNNYNSLHTIWPLLRANDFLFLNHMICRFLQDMTNNNIIILYDWNCSNAYPLHIRTETLYTRERIQKWAKQKITN